jgi:hypothetical protein
MGDVQVTVPPIRPTFGALASAPERCSPSLFAHEGAQEHYKISMKYFSKRWLACCGFPFLIVLGGCGAGPECDSIETRNAVLQTVSNDHSNPLAGYAAKNPNTAKPSDGSAEGERSRQQPMYLLGEKIVTASTSQDKRTLKCSGAISATVGETKASKEVNFTVQQAPDGKISVSVDPFRF